MESLDGSNGFASTGHYDLGYSVDGAGDINGDNISDIIVGSPDSAQSYVIFGSKNDFPGQFNLANLNGTNGFVIKGQSFQRYNIGYSVSGAGDVNTTRRGTDKTIYQITIILGIIFAISLILGETQK